MLKSDGRVVLSFVAIECRSCASCGADETYEQKNVKYYEMIVKVTPFLDAAMPCFSLTSTGNSSETLPSFQFICFGQRNSHKIMAIGGRLDDDEDVYHNLRLET